MTAQHLGGFMVTIQNKSILLLNNLDKLIANKTFENKKIVLFGLNTSSYTMQKYLQVKGYSICSYIDNNDKKVLETQELLYTILKRHTSPSCYEQLRRTFIPAYKPANLLMPFCDDYVILIASKYYPSMCQQLQAMGYKENIHIFRTVDFYELDEILKDESDVDRLIELDSDSIRKKQLEIVAYLVDTCNRHNLNIYMTGGTLLGAVRHSGFIPWDDDVDLTIPMPDYKELIDIIIEENQYDVFTIYNEPDLCSNFYMCVSDRDSIVKRWNYPFLTTTGIDVDVFPLIGLPKQLDEQKVFFNRIRHLNTIFTNSFLDYLDDDVEEIAYRKTIREEICEMMEQYNFYESKMAGYILSKYWEKDIMPQNIYEDTILMQFENLELPAPSGYDVYLQNIFGDYMKLPPEKERYATHNARAYHKS